MTVTWQQGQNPAYDLSQSLAQARVFDWLEIVVVRICILICAKYNKCFQNSIEMLESTNEHRKTSLYRSGKAT
jgi:hypothetical protein